MAKVFFKSYNQNDNLLFPPSLGDFIAENDPVRVLNAVLFNFKLQFINTSIEFMEQNSQMTAEQSLQVINETLNNNRREIIKNSGSYFILWGCVLFLVAMSVLLLWGRTGSPVRNFLWFLIPVVGYPLAALIYKKFSTIPSSFVGSLLGWSWSSFGAFSLILSVCAILWAPMSLTLVIIILFGFTESMSGIILKNWPIIIAGLLTGIIGAVVAGVILALTGVMIKFIKK